MYLLHLFKSMPLPFMTFLLPFTGAVVYGALLIYNRVLAERTGRSVSFSRTACKFPFLLILIVNMIFSYLVWGNNDGATAPIFVLTSGGWTSVLGAAGNLRAAVRVDAFGAASAALMSFIAFTAGVRALADKDNILTPRRAAFFLLTCAGAQGIFYANGLGLLFVLLMIVQAGVTGLYREHSKQEHNELNTGCYYLSRLLLLVLFLLGTVLLKSEYGTDTISTLASVITPTKPTLWAFVFLTVPLLYIFAKPSPYVADAARSCFFGIRVQATLFIAFRIIFTLFGPMQELGKVPYIFLMLGAALTAAAFCRLCGQKDPVSFSNAISSYMKGMIFFSIGASVYGTLSAENAAMFGVSALEAMISLWLIFLPVSAVLSIITVFLKQQVKGRELWQERGLLRVIPFTGIFLLVILAIVTGLPPFVGYSGKQLLFRSVSFISPAVLLLLVSFTMLMLFTGLRFAVTLLTGRSSLPPDAECRSETTIILPLFLIFMLLASATLLPGAIFDKTVSPSVECLINRTVPTAPQSAEVSQ